MLAGFLPAAASDSATIGLFGTREFHSDNLTSFKKWQATLQRHERELASCAPDDCGSKTWRDLLTSLGGHDVATQLHLVNRAINRHRYVEDAVNWAQADYWATPLQFLDRSGDCEDFAIAKYWALRGAGVPSPDLRIVVLRDLHRQEMHAVLAVYVDGTPYILDIWSDAVVAAANIRGYEPIYSINEHGWWLHRG